MKSGKLLKQKHLASYIAIIIMVTTNSAVAIAIAITIGVKCLASYSYLITKGSYIAYIKNRAETNISSCEHL